MALTHDGSARAAHAEPVGPADQLSIVLESLDNSKAEDIVAIDVTGKTPIADHMVVASGRSHRHVGAVADHLMRALKTGGVKSVRVEGQSACDWVLIDAGDVIIHVFRPEVRQFYNLEKMWQMESASHVELVV
ncbi:MAG: ribosome silencing factor [Pseudomonadota bacterium]